MQAKVVFRGVVFKLGRGIVFFWGIISHASLFKVARLWHSSQPVLLAQLLLRTTRLFIGKSSSTMMISQFRLSAVSGLRNSSI
jgi:hypothetical protein